MDFFLFFGFRLVKLKSRQSKYLGFLNTKVFFLSDSGK